MLAVGKGHAACGLSVVCAEGPEGLAAGAFAAFFAAGFLAAFFAAGFLGLLFCLPVYPCVLFGQLIPSPCSFLCWFVGRGLALLLACRLF